LARRARLIERKVIDEKLPATSTMAERLAARQHETADP
jgi:hypothetical protein